MTSSDTSELVRASEAARRLSIHPRTLARWSEQGILPDPVRLGPGQRRYYRVSDIDAVLTDGAVR